jgi:hypothetical protein
MSSSQHSVKVLGVFTVPARLPALLVVIGAPGIKSLRLGDSWYFDPVSRSLWSLTSIALSDSFSLTTEAVGLLQISGNGKLVEGLELHLVPIGWQP